jgi:hypothetical protein
VADSVFYLGRKLGRRDASLRHIKDRIIPESPVPGRGFGDRALPPSLKGVITTVGPVEDQSTAERRASVSGRDVSQVVQ